MISDLKHETEGKDRSGNAGVLSFNINRDSFCYIIMKFKKLN